MVKLIALYADSKSLRLQIEKNGWCTVVIRCKKKEIILGALMCNSIQKCLYQALSDILALQPAGKFEGEIIRWVLGLNEKHCSIYASGIPFVNKFYIQDENAQIIDIINLTNIERLQWLEILSEETFCP